MNKNHGFAVWLWPKPRILATSGWCVPFLSPEPTIVILYVSWHATGAALLKRHRDWLKARPQDTLFHFVEEAASLRTFRGSSVNAVYVSLNAWLDFAEFRPVELDNEFDAVLPARMNPVKRHELAAAVEKLLVLGGSTAWDPPGYTSVVKAALPRATIMEIRGAMRFAYARAKVGLCLSAEEGACRSGTEMQLCGLPVVTTHARGARIETLHPTYMTVVADTPEAVADGVRYWLANRPDPWDVRNATLEKMRRDRQVGVDAIQQIFDEHHITVEFAGLLHTRPVKFLECRDLSKIETFLEQDTKRR